MLGRGFGPLPPVLKRHLQGDLDGGGAVVGVEDVVEAGRRQFDEAAGQADGGDVGDAQQRAMGDGVELFADGGVDLGDAMAVDVAPQRRDAVEVLAAVEIDEEAAVRRGDDERRFGGVRLHRREGVPDVVAVPLFELFAGRHRFRVQRRAGGVSPLFRRTVSDGVHLLLRWKNYLLYLAL